MSYGFRLRILAAICLLAAAPAAVPSWAAVIHVPGQLPTIQAGIQAAGTDDTVLVASGIYAGPGNRDIDFGGKILVLKSANGPSATIVDCQGSETDPHRGFHFHSGESGSAVVDGFTILHGHRNYVGGAGIYCDGSSPTIRNCILAENTVRDAGEDGGGILLRSSQARIESCTLANNSASYGGGLACRASSTPIISGCTIVENHAGYGGGIDGGGTSASQIIDCTIAGNEATGEFGNQGSGGGIVLGGSPLVEGCTITGNVAGFGAGVACWNGSPRILRCTISGNDARDRTGGGIITQNAAAIVERTVLWGNCAGLGPEFVADAGSTLTFTCCVRNPAGVAQNGGQVIDGGGNLDEDPLFCDPEACGNAPTTAGGYQVARTSPCLPENNGCGWIGALGVGCPASFAEEIEGIHQPSLGPVIPNPSADEITLRIDLPDPSPVKLALFDVTGRVVEMLFEGDLAAGQQILRLRPHSNGGMPAGVYTIRCAAGSYRASRRIILLR